MSKYKIVTRTKTEKLPSDIQRMVDKGQADRVVAPADSHLLANRRSAIVTIHKGRLLVGEV